MPDVERYLNCVLRLCEPCRRSPGCGRESPQGAEGLCAHRRRPALGGERCEEKVRKVPAERGEAAARRGEWRNFAPTVVFFFFFLTYGDAMNRCRAAHAHPRGSPCAHTAQRSAGPGPAGGGQRGGTGGPLGLGGGWLPAAACGAAGSAFCGTLPLKMAWRPLLGGCGGSSPAPQAFRRFKMLFFKHHFYSSPSMWSLGRRRGTDSRLSVLPSRCPPRAQPEPRDALGLRAALRAATGAAVPYRCRCAAAVSARR